MKSDNKIGKKEAIYFVLILIINQIILNLPKTIIKETSTGTFVNLLVVGTIAFIIALLISAFFKRFQNSDIIDVSEYLGGKILKTIIGLAYIIFFSLLICTVLLKFISIIKVIYFPKAPHIYVFLFFLATIGLANFLGKRSILKTNALIVPIIIFSLIVILFGISGHININRLFPILGKDLKSTFVTGLSNIHAFNTITYLMFLMPLLKEKKDFKKVTIISMLLYILFFIFITTTLILTFPFITESEEIMSVYLLVRVLEFGAFFQRMDALFIFLWILSALSYLSINLMLILNIFSKLTKISNPKQMSFCFSSILFAIALLLNNQYILNLLNGPIYKYFILILVFGISMLILIFANLKHLIKNSKIFKKKYKVKTIVRSSTT